MPAGEGFQSNLVESSLRPRDLTETVSRMPQAYFLFPNIWLPLSNGNPRRRIWRSATKQEIGAGEPSEEDSAIK